MAREALVKSGVFSPTPAQNSFMPPPVPVDSTTGVLNLPPWPSFSATAVVNGKHGRRTDDLDLVARGGVAQRDAASARAAADAVTEVFFHLAYSCSEMVSWSLVAPGEALAAALLQLDDSFVSGR